jgi:hypothetical protein
MPIYADWSIDAAAITRDADVYFEEPLTFRTAAELATLAHELVHVGQYREGMTWASYLWAARNGYAESEYEVPAYAMKYAVQEYLTDLGFP